jgi:transcriptional regulator with XRE-family HTH domain
MLSNLDGMSEDAAMGQRIAKAMEIKGVSQSELARIMGVSRMTVSQWVNGISEPRPENFVVLAYLLGTTERYLVFGDKREPQGGFPSIGPSDVRSFRRRKT